ncbi:hypothetical protein [Jiella mangrovi]|uniref:Uncharacterized protein n=1 Tax=Jiella mangrovi TaxID=2821407 RepID=A0ABS4BK61_9HYPH|nr:hypothetical protein [Jiella mangrovi]MBP0617142.1 hypothetical protein [Jiella mangrovi]
MDSREAIVSLIMPLPALSSRKDRHGLVNDGPKLGAVIVPLAQLRPDFSQKMPRR